MMRMGEIRASCLSSPLALFMLLIILPSSVHPLSTEKYRKSTFNRRELFAGFSATVALVQPWSTCHAACLSGDVSPECIGVYKLPVDETTQPYVGTEKDLKRYAPDLKYVPPVKPPATDKRALEILRAQRLAADDIRNVVASGKLEEAGLKVLNLLPKLTLSGNVILQSWTTDETPVSQLRFSKAQTNFQELIGEWGEVDVLIGQGIRGQMGVSAVAQLQILKDIQEAIRTYDDFLSAVTAS